MKETRHPDSFLGYTLVRVAHTLQKHFEEALKTCGLSARQFGVLAHLERTPGISSGRLAKLILVTPQSMGPIVQGMESAGLLEREHSQGRGYAMGIRPTSKGLETLKAAQRVVVSFEDQLLSGLEKHEAENLNTALRKLLQRWDA